MQDFLEATGRFTGADSIDAMLYSPLSLAYIGDSVYELIIRSISVMKGNAPVHKLHLRSVKYSKAASQAKMLGMIYQYLSEDEADIVRRGKNSKPGTLPKNACAGDYMSATGLEALIGWLYIKKEYDRIIFLMQKAINGLDAILKKG